MKKTEEETKIYLFDVKEIDEIQETESKNENNSLKQETTSNPCSNHIRQTNRKKLKYDNIAFGIKTLGKTLSKIEFLACLIPF